MSENSGVEWSSTAKTLHEILASCTQTWLDLQKTDANEASKTEQAAKRANVRIGLAIASRYLRLLRMDESVRKAAENEDKLAEIMRLLPEDLRKQVEAESKA